MSDRSTIQGVNESSALPIETKPEKRRVDPAEAADFQQMLKQKNTKDVISEEEKSQALLNEKLAAKSSLEGILTPTVHTGLPFPAQVSLSNTLPTDGQDHKLIEIINLIVQKISTVSTEHHKEIRITLQEHVLQGTEIRISAENQHLAVQFITAASDVNQWLEQRRINIQNTLEAELAKKFNRQVSLLISITSDEHSREERLYS